METKNLRKSRFWLKIMFITTLLLLLPFGQTFAQGPNLVKNGGFEDGFISGLGIGEGWHFFRSDNAIVGFQDDTWSLVVVEGAHSQLIEMVGATTENAHAGIYQNVPLTPGQTYTLSFKGLIRSDEGDIETSSYGYRLEYAIDLSGNQDWEKVTNWVELPWDEQPRTAPNSGAGYEINTLKKTFTAVTDSVTIFIRAWKKWADSSSGDFNLDVVRLVATDSASAASAPAAETVAEPPDQVSAAQPLPDTGGGTPPLTPDNTIWLIASAIFILFLIVGAIFGQKRRVSGYNKDH